MLFLLFERLILLAFAHTHTYTSDPVKIDYQTREEVQK